MGTHLINIKYDFPVLFILNFSGPVAGRMIIMPRPVLALCFPMPVQLVGLTALHIMSYLPEPWSRTGRLAKGIIFDTIHCQGKLVQWAELEYRG